MCQIGSTTPSRSLARCAPNITSRCSTRPAPTTSSGWTFARRSTCASSSSPIRREHAFVWPYLLHVPGVLRLRSLSLHHSRSEALQRQHRERDRAHELAFGDWDLTTAPILASRMTVVSDPYAAARLQRAYPAAPIRVVPLAVGSDTGDRSSLSSDPINRSIQALESGHEGGLTPVVGALDSSRNALIQRAVSRARDAGANSN